MACHPPPSRAIVPVSASMPMRSFLLILSLLIASSGCAGPAELPGALPEEARERALHAGIYDADGPLVAPLVAFPAPILVPHLDALAAWRLADVQAEPGALTYRLLYRHADGRCFAVESGPAESVRTPGPPSNARGVRIVSMRALGDIPAWYVLGRNESEDEIHAGPIPIEGAIARIVSGHPLGCAALTLDQADALIAGLRPLRPSHDEVGTYVPRSPAWLQARAELVPDPAAWILEHVTSDDAPIDSYVVRRQHEGPSRTVVYTRRSVPDGYGTSVFETRSVFIATEDGQWQPWAVGVRSACYDPEGSPTACG